MTDHAHAWKMVAHIDGCHWFTTSYACACGATSGRYDERDVSADSYALVWMAPDGPEEPCARCAELLAGAEPKHEHFVEKAAAAATPEANPKERSRRRAPSENSEEVDGQ
jgi:hypothetical protein